MTWALAAACGIASIPAGLRWLRVAQREHYLAPSTTRFALRWWGFGAINRMLAFVAFVGVIGVLWSPWLGFLVALAQIGPVGLSLRGRTSPLAWTPRLRRLAVTSGVLVALAYLIGGLTQSPFVVVVGLFALPALVDVALMALTPVEKSLGDQWVIKAASRLKSSGADVVAITGSYGKTTTKGYVVHLLSGSKRVVASPASFNNRMGLARAINEQLVPGTQVFVAEMGTYGPGEIADLCEWIPPKVAAIVAVGPVHLERFKTEERIVSAKSEILDNAGVGVIAVDNHLLADLADSRSSKMDVMTAGTGDTEARVVVRDRALFIDGVRMADVGGVDLQILGIGANGHIGFNEPGSSLGSMTRIKTLTTKTREDNARFFESIDEVPKYAVTMGIGTILNARRVVLLANGENKAEAVAAALEGPVTASCPASALQLHRYATYVIDGAAASRLQLEGYEH